MSNTKTKNSKVKRNKSKSNKRNNANVAPYHGPKYRGGSAPSPVKAVKQIYTGAKKVYKWAKKKLSKK